MKKVLTTLGVLGAIVLAQALVPEKAQARDGSWEDVCCGSTCVGGQDYCLGNGTYSCCKAEAEQ